MFDNATIQKASEGDISALVELDRRGLLAGAHETLAEYIERLRCLQKNTTEMDRILTKEGRYEVEGVILEQNERIPRELFEEVRGITAERFGFAVDWVPGFYINPAFGWLFGGCAFHFYPDFFALFTIRKSFADRERWLIYTRRELLAHELCHVARIGLESSVFEEMFAYRTATSRLRRMIGGVFRSPVDSLGLLAVTFLLLAAQILRVWYLPGLPIWPFWAAVAGDVLLLGLRQVFFAQKLSRAAENVEALTGGQCAEPFLFRCTDEEILSVARMESPGDLRDWISKRADSSLRWRVIRTRFVADSVE